jgi:endonuclease YncB( thermonuclease family)
MAAFLPSCALANDLAPKITQFYDGDTVKIQDGLNAYKLRLTDIDAPERNQSYGKTARRALAKLCQNANIQVYLSGIDKYQRNLGKLSCNNQDVSVFMISNGHAWFNRRYSMDYTLDLAEQAARTNKIGLWKRKNPTPPWQWRQHHSHT